jgi:hypothetical protein
MIESPEGDSDFLNEQERNKLFEKIERMKPWPAGSGINPLF